MSNIYTEDLRKENEDLRDKLKASNNLLIFYIKRLREVEAKLAQMTVGDTQSNPPKMSGG
jgi:hypothetical protein